MTSILTLEMLPDPPDLSSNTIRRCVARDSVPLESAIASCRFHSIEDSVFSIALYLPKILHFSLAGSTHYDTYCRRLWVQLLPCSVRNQQPSDQTASKHTNIINESFTILDRSNGASTLRMLIDQKEQIKYRIIARIAFFDCTESGDHGDGEEVKYSGM